MYEQRRHKAHAQGSRCVPDESDDYYALAGEKLRKRRYEIARMPDENGRDERKENLLALLFLFAARHHHDEDQLEHCSHEVAYKLYQLAKMHDCSPLLFYHSLRRGQKGGHAKRATNDMKLPILDCREKKQANQGNSEKW
ncbi:MAG: hypothetical protein HY801_03325 [Candidatus Lindowbacteria bacterium]|nr:hypothetical protein [Candidatus Lindowbacteria bacterium]